jgi:predicted nucleic acid-binding protein
MPDYEAFMDLIERTPPVVPSQSPLLVRDPKDDMILAAAIGGNADFLVTGDADLLVLANDPKLGHLRIVSPSEFLSLLSPLTTEAETSP